RVLVLERIALPVRLWAPGVEERPALAVVVAGARARNHDVEYRVGEAGFLQRAQRFVVQADGFGLVAGRGVAFDQHDGDAGGGQQVGDGQPDRSTSDDQYRKTSHG